MKLPKTTKRFCPYCKKNTEQKIDLLSTGGKRGALKKGSLERAKMRGANSGKGSQGKYSKPPVKKWKRKTKTTTKKVIIYKCKECNKSKPSKNPKRVSKLIIGEK